MYTTVNIAKKRNTVKHHTSSYGQLCNGRRRLICLAFLSHRGSLLLSMAMLIFSALHCPTGVQFTLRHYDILCCWYMCVFSLVFFFNIPICIKGFTSYFIYISINPFHTRIKPDTAVLSVECPSIPICG